MPTISVILPVYNSEEYVSESINSILSQTFEDFEFLIINDGSTDQSKDIIMSHNDKRINYIENMLNQGLIKTLNKGLHFAHGQYIARMDADDLCQNSRFEKQIDYFRSDRQIDILGTNQYIIGTCDKIIHKLSNEENKIRLLLQPVVGHSTVMIKKEALDKNNLYYDRFALYAEDYKLWVDARLCNLFIENINECLCGYRIHEKQISNTESVIQRHIADKIRIAYAKNFFYNIIDGNEREYLFLIHGINSSLKNIFIEKIEELYLKLLLENSLNGFFNIYLFDDFFKHKMLNIRNG